MSKKAINLNDLNTLVSSFNEVAIELNALMAWASNMHESGLTSSGPKMTKQRLTKIKKMVRELELACKPARDTVQAIRDSGHFDRSSTVPLHFHRGAKNVGRDEE